MKLVLAEKPSVAQSIAKVLGAAKREDGYLEGNGYVVSWCVGHLVELAQPEVYDAKYSKWAYADLPIFPMDWQYEVSAGTKKQFGILKKLMAREDVASLVCATDAGREGELIFRLVYHKAGCRKPFERLWISSMEDRQLEDLYVKFNIDHPDDFRGHSMSVSDIVALKVVGEVSFHYVDSVGFQKLENFMKSENYLKNAEMAMEDDYGMIDGIINNGKASGLEERPSVLEQLKEKPVPDVSHKPPKSHPEREIE